MGQLGDDAATSVMAPISRFQSAPSTFRNSPSDSTRAMNSRKSLNPIIYLPSELIAE
jgi:hypothetical protein